MPDGVVNLAQLARQTPKTLAIKTAREYPDSMEPFPIPQKGPLIAHLSRKRLDEMKASAQSAAESAGHASLEAAWLEWQLAFSSSILENANRLRGALWCYRELVKHNDDLDCLDLADKVLELLNQRWGVYAVPSDRTECDQVARETAQSMARVETRRWEDRAQ